MDFFTGSPFIVELEKDLALKKQLLDVVVLRRGPGLFAGRLPDGLDNLAAHNLIAFKSHHDALDDWTLKELTGHYVNYRKQCSARHEPLLPEADFRLYAVCSRHPHNLANDVRLDPVHQGVLHVQARHRRDPDYCGRSGVPRAPQCAPAPVQCIGGNGRLWGRPLRTALARQEFAGGTFAGELSRRRNNHVLHNGRLPI